MRVTLVSSALLRLMMRWTSSGSLCANGASASRLSEACSANWVCFRRADSLWYSSAPTTCESRMAAVATFEVSRLSAMLPFISFSVCACTCSCSLPAWLKPTIATPLTISVTATTSRLNISRRPRAPARKGSLRIVSPVTDCSQYKSSFH